MISVIRKAAFSRCGKYRYALWREWDPALPRILFIGLNPATADDRRDDNTMRRCMAYARAWGFGGMAVGNLFAFRAVYPEQLRKTDDPVGPGNDRWLRRLSGRGDMALAMWGNHGSYLGRAEKVRRMFARLYCFKVTQKGQPHHTRGLPNGLRPVLFPVKENRRKIRRDR